MTADSEDSFDGPDDRSEHYNYNSEQTIGSTADVSDSQIVKAEIVVTDSDPIPLSMSGGLSWLVIAIITALMMLMVATESAPVDFETAPETSAAELMQIQMQGKMIVAQNMLKEMAEGDKQVEAKAEPEETSDLDEPALENSMADDSAKGDSDEELTFDDEVSEVEEGIVDEESVAESGNILPADVVRNEFRHEVEESVAEIVNVLPSVLNQGPYAQRIAYAILLNEVAGADAALVSLAETDQRLEDSGLKLTENQQRLRDVVGGLLESYAVQDWAAKKVSDIDKDWLSGRMKWLGKLAQAPRLGEATELRESIENEALGTLVKSGVAMLVGFLCGVAGLVLAVILFLKLKQGKLKRRFEHRTSRQNIYVETFAIWMLVFFGGQILVGVVLHRLGLDKGITPLALTPAIFFASLIALDWPVLRGVSHSEVRRDIGWSGSIFTESLTGLVAYLAMIPAVVLAFIVVMILMATFAVRTSPENFSNAGGPSHPIQDLIMQGDLLVIGLVFLAACVAAPIVEETMFRGVLYRHLRDWTVGWRISASVIFSCIIGSFVFAAIHPQGIYGVPLLMTLAIGFSLVREWRDSLFAAITMHAINNGAVTLVMLLVL